MVKQPKEKCYSRDVNLINEMKDVFDMRYVQHLRESEILSRTGLNRTRYYKILRTFAAEYPDLADQMKKKGNDVTPEDYMLKTDDIHPPKSVISVHFFCLTCLMALQI